MPYFKMSMWDFQCEILNALNFTLTDFYFSLFMVISILPENISCQASIPNQLVVKFHVDLTWRRPLKSRLKNVGVVSRKLYRTTLNKARPETPGTTSPTLCEEYFLQEGQLKKVGDKANGLTSPPNDAII